jgi:flagellar biosynthetic protein FliP
MPNRLLVILFILGFACALPVIHAQDLTDEGAIGFDEDFDFTEEDLLRESNENAEDIESLTEALEKPGSVESMVYLADQIEQMQEPGKLAPVMRIAFSLTLLTLLPAVLLTMTSFTRIIIVFSFVRRALTLQTLPPNQIIIGLSLFLTWFIMAPTVEQLHETALRPMMDNEITEIEGVTRARDIMHGFMMRYTRDKELAMFIELAGDLRPKGPEDVPMNVLIPAFVVSELKTAFQMGFVIFLPFLVIDIVIATVLTSMGMFMLPPPMISIPFKILLFVLVDGWTLIVKSLALSFMV